MGCEGCPLHGQRDNKIIRAQGPRHAEIMFIGEAPHTHELEDEKPFSENGKSGELLMHVLGIVGLERQDVVIANAIRCKINKDIPKEVTQAFKHCKEHLHRLILQVKPRLIVTLGDFALRQVLKMQKIMSNRGRFFTMPFSNLRDGEEGHAIVFVSVHPAYVLRGSQKGFPDIPFEMMGFKEKIFIGDFNTLKEYIHNNFVVKRIDVSGYQPRVRGFKGRVVSVDIELTSREYRLNSTKVLCIGMTDTMGNAQIHVGDIPPAPMLKMLQDPEVVKLVAARPFDENVLHYKCGVDVRGPVIDVLSLAQVLDENYTHNLENVANAYTKLKNIKDLSEGLRHDMSKLPTEKLIAYNGVDVDATFSAYKTMAAEIKRKPGLLNYYKHFIIPVQNMFRDTSRRGMPIDLKALAKSELDLDLIIAATRAECEGMIPARVKKKYVEKAAEGEELLNKNALIVDYLFKHKQGLRIKPLMVTPKTKAPTVKEAHLQMLSENAFIPKFLDFKRAMKIRNTYIERLKAAMVRGKVYPDTIIRTVTGRTVMHNPEIQTYPKHGNFAPFIRRAVIPPKGYVLGARDLSQSELRIIGWLAQDPGILNALAQGIDLHTKTARDVLKKNVVDDAARTSAKAVNFGFVYGMQPKGFQTYARETYNVIVTMDQAIQFREEFFETYARLPVYHNTMIEFAKLKGFVISPLGRRRRLPSIHSDDWGERSEAERQAINSPVQSFSSDLGLIGMMLANAKNSKICIPMWFIHDEIIFLIKRGHEEEAHKLLKHCMEVEAPAYIKEHWGVEIGYPVESDGKVGENWSVMKKVPW